LRLDYLLIERCLTTVLPRYRLTYIKTHNERTNERSHLHLAVANRIHILEWNTVIWFLCIR